VRGWDRSGIRVRMRAIGQAATAARAQEIASAVNLSIVGSVIRADGPPADAGEHWAAEFDVDVPDDVMMKLRARNGEIALDNVLGSGEFQTDNGAIRLSGVNGDLRGTTRNGGVEVTLRGRTWIGAGLDVSTRNGRVQLFIPTDYSAELEAGTVNGDLEADLKFATATGRSGRVRTALGNGGSPVRVLTRNGRVTLTQR
jgi:DUF4097 and DUF4098 domain-containing protein YvlB